MSNTLKGDAYLLREETICLLEKFGIFLDPSLDEQHLVDADVIEHMIAVAGVTGDDAVLEVGAGCGNITLALAEAAGMVFAVEKNEKFHPMLKERTAPYGNVELIQGDALKIGLPSFNKLVSNLPYSICEAFMQRLIHLDFRCASIIVSSSFARIVKAREGEPRYSRLSLMANAFFAIDGMEEIGQEAYHPPTRKSTALIRLKPRKAENLRGEVLRGVLLQGDRKLKNALREAIISSNKDFDTLSTKREARAWVRSIGLGKELLESRVGHLSLPELLRLSRALEEVNCPGTAQPPS